MNFKPLRGRARWSALVWGAESKNCDDVGRFSLCALKKFTWFFRYIVGIHSIPSIGCNYLEFQVNIQRCITLSKNTESCNYLEFQVNIQPKSLQEEGAFCGCNLIWRKFILFHTKKSRSLWPRDLLFHLGVNTKKDDSKESSAIANFGGA